MFEDIRTFVATPEESKDREKLLNKLLTMKKPEDMAKSLQDTANKYQLNFVAEDTTPLPKSAVVNFSKPAKSNWASYEVLSNFTTEAGKAVADLEASELKSGATGRVIVVSEEKTAEILKERI